MHIDPQMKLPKPCPFCSEQAYWGVIKTSNGSLATQCGACGAQGPLASSEDSARMAWDVRQQPTTEERKSRISSEEIDRIIQKSTDDAKGLRKILSRVFRLP